MHRRSLFSFLAITPLGLIVQPKEPKPDVRAAPKPCICGSDIMVLRDGEWTCSWCKRPVDEDAG